MAYSTAEMEELYILDLITSNVDRLGIVAQIKN